MTGLLTLAMMLLVAADEPTSNSGQQDIKRLQGTWRFESVEVEGEKMPPVQARDSKLRIEGTRFTVMEGSTVTHGTFKIDAMKTPKTIDVRFEDGEEKGKTALGIYEVDDDTYRVCLGFPGVSRPKEFVSKPQSGHVFEVFKRVKTESGEAGR